MNENAEIVVCDIDGTISLVSPTRADILNDKDPDWDRFYEDAFEDQPVDKVCRLVRHLSQHYHVVFCTSRRDSVREKTERWLRSHLAVDRFPKGWNLLMRRGLDPRPDTIVKPELLDAFLKDNDDDAQQVLCVLEDSAAMVKRWNELGYTSVQVA